MIRINNFFWRVSWSGYAGTLTLVFQPNGDFVTHATVDDQSCHIDTHPIITGHFNQGTGAISFSCNPDPLHPWIAYTFTGYAISSQGDVAEAIGGAVRYFVVVPFNGFHLTLPIEGGWFAVPEIV